MASLPGSIVTAVNHACTELKKGGLLLLCAVAVTGCSAIQHSTPVEPSVISVRNSSGMHIQEVSFSSVIAGNHRATRVGSVSPVPQGVTQSIGRATRAPRLPMQVRINWIDHQGHVVSRDISLGALLNHSTGVQGEALVFDIRGGGEVSTSLELPLKKTEKWLI